VIQSAITMGPEAAKALLWTIVVNLAGRAAARNVVDTWIELLSRQDDDDMNELKQDAYDFIDSVIEGEEADDGYGTDHNDTMQ